MPAKQGSRNIRAAHSRGSGGGAADSGLPVPRHPQAGAAISRRVDSHVEGCPAAGSITWCVMTAGGALPVAVCHRQGCLPRSSHADGVHYA
jgi:hypothetical protein